MALDGSGIETGNDVWFVGDGAIDVECAINSGLTPVLLMYEGTEQELGRHNLVQFVATECRLRGMEGLKKAVENQIFPISEK
jgi:phosphoglycolate phosphatase-like HAD superfamily hydrolase